MTSTPPAEALADRLESLTFLDAPGRALGRTIRGLVPAGPVKDVLSGVPIGHALHPLLTDVPIGTWTSAALLDVLGGRDAATATRRLIGAGLAAAVPTAVTGWSDWADAEPSSPAARRAGLVHAAANVTAVGLMAASLSARRRGATARGKLLSLAGLSALGAGGWIGGHLSYARAVGVGDRAVAAPQRTAPPTSTPGVAR